MKSFIGGLVVGVVVGTGAMSADTVRYRYFYSTAEYARDLNGLETIMYAAGVKDALEAIVWYSETSERSYEDDAAAMSRYRDCLRLRSANLGALDSYATVTARKVAADRSEKTPAALAIMANACGDADAR